MRVPGDLLEDIYPDVDLEPELVELVLVRVSQMDHCATCLSIHVQKARKVGVTQRKMDILPAWRDARDLYNDQERAALELTETLTTLPRDTRR